MIFGSPGLVLEVQPFFFLEPLVIEEDFYSPEETEFSENSDEAFGDQLLRFTSKTTQHGCSTETKTKAKSHETKRKEYFDPVNPPLTDDAIENYPEDEEYYDKVYKCLFPVPKIAVWLLSLFLNKYSPGMPVGVL